MIRPSPDLLRRITEDLAPADVAEMAVPSYLHPNPALRWMAWRRLEVIAAEVERLCRGRSLNVLDFGCGGGVLFEEVLRHGARLHATDLVLDPARRLAAERKLRVDLVHPDELERTLARSSIDLIVAAEVLEHIEPVQPTLELFRRLLQPEGQLLVSLPTENTLYRMGRRLAGFDGHYHHSNARTIDAAIRRAGFARTALSRSPAPGPLAIYWIARYVVSGPSAAP